MMLWSPEHDEMLRDLHPVQGIVMRDIAVRINAEHGTAFSARHISNRSAELGLPKRGRPYSPKARASQWWIHR